MISDYSGCGTGIKWTFVGAKYSKGTKIIKDNQKGVIEEAYYLGSTNVYGYIVKLDDGSQVDIKEKDIEVLVG